MPSTRFSRRHFIKSTSAAMAFAAMRANGINFTPPPATRRIALIGTGWYGKSDLFRLMQVVPADIVVLCDV